MDLGKRLVQKLLPTLRIALVDPPLSTWMKLPLGAGHLAFARALGAARAGRVQDRFIEARRNLAPALPIARHDRGRNSSGLREQSRASEKLDQNVVIRLHL